MASGMNDFMSKWLHVWWIHLCMDSYVTVLIAGWLHEKVTTSMCDLMLRLAHVNVTSCQRDLISAWLHVRLVSGDLIYMWSCVRVASCQGDLISRWRNISDIMSGWHHDRVASWEGDLMTEWSGWSNVSSTLIARCTSTLEDSWLVRQCVWPSNDLLMGHVIHQRLISVCWIRWLNRGERWLASFVERRGFDFRPSKANDLQNQYLSLASLVLTTNRILVKRTECLKGILACEWVGYWTSVCRQPIGRTL